jgi:hypothetical protein
VAQSGRRGAGTALPGVREAGAGHGGAGAANLQRSTVAINCRAAAHRVSRSAPRLRHARPPDRRRHQGGLAAPRTRQRRDHLGHLRPRAARRRPARGRAVPPARLRGRGMTAVRVCRMFADGPSAARSGLVREVAETGGGGPFSPSDLRFLPTPTSRSRSRARARRGCCPGRPASSARRATCAGTPARTAPTRPAPRRPGPRSRPQG